MRDCWKHPPPTAPSETMESAQCILGWAADVVVCEGDEVQPQWERKSDEDVFKSKLCFSDCFGIGSHPEGSSNPGEEEKIFSV